MKGTIHDSHVEVKFGESFPKVNDENKIINSQGIFVVKYLHIGTPKWTSKLTVRIPVKVMIVDVIELTRDLKAKSLGIHVVKH